MPVRKMTKSPRSAVSTQLTDALTREWKNPSASANEPVILIEDIGPQLQHIYVVWEAWKDFPQVERSEIIMDAAEEVMGSPAVLNITVAMGLTEAEADRMGIR